MEAFVATYYDAVEKTWHGPKCKSLYSENLTLGEAIYDTLKKNPNKIIQIHDQTGEKLTCSELLQYAELLSKNLYRMGLGPGDVIGLYAENWTHVTTIMLASFLCGTPVNATYPGFERQSLSWIYNNTKPKILFCEEKNFKVAQSICEDLNIPIYLVNGEVEGVPHIRDLLKVNEEIENFRFPCQDLKGDDTAVVLCSSGTTGMPKGVLCSNRALLNQRIYLTLTSESVLFTYSTMYWASGLWTLISSLLNGTLRIVTCQEYTPKHFLNLVKQYKISHSLVSVPHMNELSICDNFSLQEIQKSLESIDSLIVGGTKVPYVLQEKMTSWLENNIERPGLMVAYGMSELVAMVTLNSGQFMERILGTEGKLKANCTVRIINKEGQRLGPMEHGEICVHTPYKWSGYINNPEATSKAYRDNWLYSGDIGYFDEQGYLHVMGRDNDVFRHKGFQVYPPLMEEIILQVPGISEACVFGLPDFLTTNRIVCVIVRASNQDGENLTIEHINQHVVSTMGYMYHIDGGIYFVNSFPKTGSGKVQRNEVRKMVLDKVVKQNGNNNNIESNNIHSL